MDNLLRRYKVTRMTFILKEGFCPPFNNDKRIHNVVPTILLSYRRY